MRGVGKAAFAALCFNLAAYGSAFSDETPATGVHNDTDRLEKLLETIDQQSAKLAQQQADIDRQRLELEKQKAELLKLQASMAKSTTPAVADTVKAKPSQVASGNDAHAAIVRTRYGYIPVPREAPRLGETQSIASQAAPSATAGQSVSTKTQAHASDEEAAASTDSAGQERLTGSTAKNDFSIPAPQSTIVAENSGPYNPYDSDGGIHLHTLKDLVDAAIAPTLTGQSEVGEKPKTETPSIDIAVLADRGGVLTPKGTLVITPQIDYTHSSVERFFFDGVELVEAVNIGNVLAESIDRDSITSTFAFRYGITPRLEVDAQVPFLYRDDRTIDKNFQISGFPETEQALRGDDIGDIEFGAHYQLNRPKGPYPYFVAGIRAKSPTGNGPFDIPYDLQKGLPLNLPTGSGFWTVEPQFTMIYPSDPVVLFANIGYQYTFSQNVNKIVLDTLKTPNPATSPDPTQEEDRTTVTNVEPGGTLDIGLGMGIGLNDSVSMSIGYQHSWVMGTDTHTRSDALLHDLTTTEVNLTGTATAVSHSDDAQLGELLIGASIAVDNHVGLNFNIGIGVTDDAPDVTVTFRTPLTWRLFR